jgi:hypothetical protein
MTPQKHLGRYEITRVIEEGGMSTVYEARDPVIGRTVAIKTIDLKTIEVLSNQAEEVRERLRLESRFLGALSHPNIVTVYDVGEVEGLAFIVMEILSGKTLQDLLNETEPSEWPGLFAIISQLNTLPACWREGVKCFGISVEKIFATAVNAHGERPQRGMKRGRTSLWSLTLPGSVSNLCWLGMSSIGFDREALLSGAIGKLIGNRDSDGQAVKGSMELS